MAADAYGLLRQAARRVLRNSHAYRVAVEQGQGRAWLSREGNRLADLLDDEAWKWTPRDPDALRETRLSEDG